MKKWKFIKTIMVIITFSLIGLFVYDIIFLEKPLLGRATILVIIVSLVLIEYFDMRMKHYAEYVHYADHDFCESLKERKRFCKENGIVYICYNRVYAWKKGPYRGEPDSPIYKWSLGIDKKDLEKYKKIERSYLVKQ